MPTNSKLCIYCKQPLDLTHGNRRYHKPCAIAAKRQRSTNRYAKQNLLIDPCWRNEKILREFYMKHGGQAKHDPDLLTACGFNFKLYKQKASSNNVTKFFMNDYGFSFLINEQLIIIWKR